MRRFSSKVLRIFNVAPSTDIMGATTLFFSGQSRPIPTIGKSRCCLLAAAMVDLSVPTNLTRPIKHHEEEGFFKARAAQAETALSGRSAQGVCGQGNGVLCRAGFRRRDARPGAPAGCDAAI